MSSPSDSQIMEPTTSPPSDALPGVWLSEKDIVTKPRCVIAEVWAIKGPHSSKNDGYMHINAPVRDIDGRRFVMLRMKDDWLCKFLTGKSPKTYPAAGSTMLTTLRHALQDAQTHGTNEIMKQSSTKSVLQKSKLSKNFGAKCAKQFLKSVDVVNITVPFSPGSPEQTHMAMLNDAKTLSMEQSEENFDWMCRWAETETRLPKRSDSSWYCRGPVHEGAPPVDMRTNRPATKERFTLVTSRSSPDVLYTINPARTATATVEVTADDAAEDAAEVAAGEVTAGEVTADEVAADEAAWWLCEHDEVRLKAVEVTAGTGAQANEPIVSPIHFPPVPLGSIRFLSLACGHTNTGLRAMIKPAHSRANELWPNEATGFVFNKNYYDTMDRPTVKCVRKSQRSKRDLGGPDHHLELQPDSFEIISGVNPGSAHYYQSKGRWCIKALMCWSPSFFLRSALAEWRSHAQQMAYQKIDLPGWAFANQCGPSANQCVS